MKKISNPIVFFGNERIATGVITDTPTLRSLIQAGYDVKAVIANFEKGKSRAPRELEIAKVAEEHGIPLLLPTKISEIKDQLSSYNAEVGILVAYGQIIPQDIIDIFPCGIVNLHPSLLPLHRGPTPVESTLLNDEPETGVSIMALAKQMDAGPVYIQVKIPLNGNESKQLLADQLLKLGSDLLIQVLPDILSGKTKAQPQGKPASYDHLISKTDGFIVWTKTAAQLEREIRAYLAWPGSRTQFFGKDTLVTKAVAIAGAGTPGDLNRDKKSLSVYCGEGALSILAVKPAGKTEMPIEAFLSGIPLNSTT